MMKSRYNIMLRVYMKKGNKIVKSRVKALSITVLKKNTHKLTMKIKIFLKSAQLQSN